MTSEYSYDVTLSDSSSFSLPSTRGARPRRRVYPVRDDGAGSASVATEPEETRADAIDTDRTVPQPLSPRIVAVENNIPNQDTSLKTTRHPSVDTRALEAVKDMADDVAAEPDASSTSSDASPQTCRGRMQMLSNSPIFGVLMLVATLYALFADDLAILALPKSVDFGISVTFVIVMFLFFFEIGLELYLEGREYARSIIFWLDLLATLSILPVLIELSVDIHFSTHYLAVAHTSRVARTAARVARVVRVIKLFTYLRRRNEKPPEVLGTDEEYDFDEDNSDRTPVTTPVHLNPVKRSKVGDRLTSRMTNYVIGIVLLIVLLYSLTENCQDDRSQLLGVSTMESHFIASNGSVTAVQEQLEEFEAFMGDDIIFLKLGTGHVSVTLINESARYDLLREDEMIHVVTSSGFSEGYFDNKEFNELSAGLAMVNTFVIMVVLGAGNFLIVKDTHNYVLRPVEHMVEILKVMSKNPLSKVPTETHGHHEARVLVKALGRLGTLLRMSFGKAGATVISRNLKNGIVSVNHPGNLQQGVFMVVGIESFQSTLRILLEHSTVFTNIIAKELHARAASGGGIPFRNTGQAFFFLWKKTQNYSAAFKWADEVATALSCVSRMKDAVEDNQQLQQIAKELTPGLFRSSGAVGDMTSRHHIRMTFALHAGWGIEGAVGSHAKIDVTYISPHVEVAQRMQYLSKVYGVEVVISGQVYESMEPNAQARFRLLDRVQWLDLEVEPVQIYSRDAINEYARTLYTRAVLDYLDGRWTDARNTLQLYQTEFGSCTASTVILSYMAQAQFRAPESFKGYRVI